MGIRSSIRALIRSWTIRRASTPVRREGLQTFSEVMSAVDKIEGMLPHFAAAVLDAILSFQSKIGVAGNLVEMGVFRGKSAVLIGSHLKQSERFLLVDINDQIDYDAISSFSGNTDIFMRGTGKLQDSKHYQTYLGSARFVHIDASHEYLATFQEMKMAEDMLTEFGIIVMDDFANLHYSQNAAAIFKYLFTSRTNLTMFLVTEQKAYLCRKNAFSSYGKFCLRRLLSEMESRNCPATLSRTDVNPEYRAFFCSPRHAGEDAFYGLEYYHSMYKAP